VSWAGAAYSLDHDDHLLRPVEPAVADPHLLADVRDPEPARGLPPEDGWMALGDGVEPGAGPYRAVQCGEQLGAHRDAQSV
jgi:hypothetical protein